MGRSGGMSIRPARSPAGNAGDPVLGPPANPRQGANRRQETARRGIIPSSFNMKPEAKEVSPRKVLAEVAAAVPPDVHPNIIIIGSLAAAYWLFRGDDTVGVRTKDIDCVLSPHLSAVEKGRAVAEKLLAAGWQPQFT